METERVGAKGGYYTDHSQVTGVGRSCHLNLGFQLWSEIDESLLTTVVDGKCP